MWTADVTDWVKQECVSNWLALSVENIAEDADDDFSVVSYIMKIMFYIRCYPNETTIHGYELRRRRHERGLNAILYTDS